MSDIPLDIYSQPSDDISSNLNGSTIVEENVPLNTSIAAGLAINITPSAEFATVSVEKAVSKLNTDGTSGISSVEEVDRRRELHGTNEVNSDDDDDNNGKLGLLKRFLSGFIEDRLILLLIGSAIVSAILHNVGDAISITAAVIIVMLVGFIQEYKSEKSIEALNKLVPAMCHLVRFGRESHVLAATLVPGDIVVFRVGDRIPADLRIIDSVDLSLDESSLTGEPDPVHKSSDPVPENPTGIIPISDRHCIAFMGTLVKEGHGRGLVVATGKKTAFGSIFEMMSTVDKPKTPLQTAMDRLGKELSLFSFVVIGIICIIGIWQGRSWLDMFQISVSLAVAAIPEGLPIIVTVTLALGVLRMAKRKAIVRRLPSVETLGSVNVICTDKTGTLTANHMTVSKMWCLSSMSTKENILNVGSTTDLRNYLAYDVKRTLEIGSLCNNATFSVEHSKFLGNPTDIAILEELTKFGLIDERDNYIKMKEISFNSKRKFMAVGLKQEKHDDKETSLMCVKGAFEVILSRSTNYLTEDGKINKLTEKNRETIIECANHLASDGLRVLAFASRPCQGDDDFTKFSEDDIDDLTFTGLIGMRDPPRATVKPAIKKLLQGGVHIIMITGDSPNTAVSIAKQIGIPVVDQETSVLTGDKLKTMTNEQLANVINHVNIFARATPEDKLNIVQALKKRGDVVAMTGDGVNDAPALKLADIGISMGIIGTDVAKEASDMILTDDDFSTILTAVEEGKGIFNNIQNFLTFQLSTSIAALSMIALATAFNLPNPLNAMQILWINILMDGPPAQSLGVEPVDHEVMKKPPRSRSERILTMGVLGRILGTAFCIILGTVFICVKEMSTNGEMSARDTTMTFTCFVFFDMFNALACRHSTKSIFQIGIFSNTMFNLSVGLSLVAQLCVIYVPVLQHIFKTENLSAFDLLLLTCLGSTVFVVDELRKFIVNQYLTNYVEEENRYATMV
ncbi:similar to Saccharomyces cerevisiae YGL167C PMR1 High affinity Ca2+/Mn2+ P-type ATPase required for Ca2+ and Mn2+ transport into Golgi [Maudiozyma saulgeensis]|uniref:Calcium-transporting ATPase n=1 Tax=Maudiozyma saulgeensis TaxID=1789683 RepID=A0A1X7QZ91_9SACH|nr:similar to Saccharomyces cerevisiae YGL167C PMR1 High affinity Ca2+/Mn2+ P-type ATPase required for Ca2+ and Mn2+ transport into Golgi [Kazachstania saulgeensis]